MVFVTAHHRLEDIATGKDTRFWEGTFPREAIVSAGIVSHPYKIGRFESPIDTSRPAVAEALQGISSGYALRFETRPDGLVLFFAEGYKTLPSAFVAGQGFGIKKPDGVLRMFGTPAEFPLEDRLYNSLQGLQEVARKKAKRGPYKTRSKETDNWATGAQFEGTYEVVFDGQGRVVIPRVLAERVKGPLRIHLGQNNGSGTIEFIVHDHGTSNIMPGDIPYGSRGVVLKNVWTRWMDGQNRLSFGKKILTYVDWAKEKCQVYFEGQGRYFLITNVKPVEKPDSGLIKRLIDHSTQRAVSA